ncbi:hypothetical protein EGW08_014880 [Elysia chlorotica]|uniref:MADF domain-containing protein n=1 Tax=Elysia chlorotica TaxID=188477 RepID=A0A433T720_ELYCH|nr:hypothetical protein EGW08_014880 [Elysia chlorotica]
MKTFKLKNGSILLDDEKLIEAVKCRPYLYNIDDPHHNSRPLLYNSWREIAQEMGHEVQTVKDRWIYMRDYYRKKTRELEKIKAGHLNKRWKKWPMFDKLDFLRKYLRPIEFDPNNAPLTAWSAKRNDAHVDSEEDDGVQLRLIKIENSDDDEEDEEEDGNQSDDSYRRDVMQALDTGQVSVELPTSKTSGKSTPGHGRSPSTRHRRDRAARGEADSPTPRQACKRQRSEMASATNTKHRPVSATPLDVTHSSAADVSDMIDPNHHFFTSLIPMIETLDPLSAMEFRYEVHGVLMRYLRQGRERRKNAARKGGNSGTSQYDDREHGSIDESATVSNAYVRHDDDIVEDDVS